MNKQHDDIVSNSCNAKKKDSGDSGILKLGSVRWHRNVNKRDGTLENISILRQSDIFFLLFFLLVVYTLKRVSCKKTYDMKHKNIL